ncbi:hypothetical protein BSX36_04535 [Listeria monocytogenes]|uniref:hypothetical protein n=1 Tax=Listeria monocytogenes TaxID=1639 RepID=UPI0011EB4DF5|nr:hypothetical protein [Listeria monocytogenes]EAE8620191.1 hypothetical protein [Listeria monocytogenes]EAE8621849.1 hypothetical protein [Listeria monocytogenes]EAE8628253.1 hypothetical protein [Listeria monocytogenes]EAE8633639.1 hypothetical protein [Listeria monocytogenes]EAE8642495.1 hypothetical protein [Listeria monocytogenes]
MRNVIESLNLELIINIIASFSTAISAWLVYVTLREMKIQRDTAYKPLLVLKTKKEIHISSKKGLLNPEKPAEIIEEGSHKMVILDPGSETLIVNIVNIGAGPAKNLSYQFDRQCFLDFFKAESNNNSNFYYENIDRRQHIKYGDKDNLGFWNLNYSMLSNSYLLPREEQSIEIYLPDIFIEILQRALKNKYFDDFTKNQFNINITYEDIQGKIFSTILPLEINLNSTYTTVYDGKDIPEDEQEITGIFRVKVF